MKQLRIIGLMLLAVFALGAFAASMASAEEGLLPTQEGTGSGNAGTLETLGGKKIACTAVNVLTILFDAGSDHHGTADLHFTGCKAEGIFPANTLLDTKEVILTKVLFLICLVVPASLIFGMWIEPDEPVHIEVPGLGSLLLVKGAVIAQLESPLKGKEFKATLEGAKGDQKKAVSCEYGKEAKKTHTLVAGLDSGSDEDASENTSFTIKFAKEASLEDA